MNADRRRFRDVADIVRIIRSESAELSCRYSPALLTRTMLLQSSCGHEECSRGRAMVMEAGRLPWHPTDEPDIVLGPAIKRLIPAPIRSQPYPVQPLHRRRKYLNDAGEFLGGSRSRCVNRVRSSLRY